jgi:hypothetical protein
LLEALVITTVPAPTKPFSLPGGMPGSAATRTYEL